MHEIFQTAVWRQISKWNGTWWLVHDKSFNFAVVIWYANIKLAIVMVDLSGINAKKVAGTPIIQPTKG